MLRNNRPKTYSFLIHDKRGKTYGPKRQAPAEVRGVILHWELCISRKNTLTGMFTSLLTMGIILPEQILTGCNRTSGNPYAPVKKKEKKRKKIRGGGIIKLYDTDYKFSSIFFFRLAPFFKQTVA